MMVGPEIEVTPPGSIPAPSVGAAARPGLSVLCPADTFVGSDEMRRRAADRAGARTAVLEGLGHYWMIEDPANSAAVLSEFWNSID